MPGTVRAGVYLISSLEITNRLTAAAKAFRISTAASLRKLNAPQQAQHWRKPPP
jgi:hypothetical protein